MSVSLTGSLLRFSSIELLTFLTENRKSGIVLIDAGGGFRIAIESGRIISASDASLASDSNPAELVIRALLQEVGSFAVIDLPLEPDREVDLDPVPLIEQARTRIEESRNYDPSFVFLLARDLESNELFAADEVRVLLEVNGRSSANEIAKRCGFSEERAGELFGSLARRGWLISRQGSRSAPRPVAGTEPGATDDSKTTAPDFLPGQGPGRDHGVDDVARMACFTLDDTNSTSFPLFDEVHTIGRGANNSIQLEDKSVSGSHARITRTPKGHLLEDLGSSNGTYVNGESIDSVILRDKDRLRLGTVFMVYMLPTEIRDPAPAADDAEP